MDFNHLVHYIVPAFKQKKSLTDNIMGFFGLLLLLYIIYLLYSSHKELLRIFSGNTKSHPRQSSPFKPSGKQSGQVKDDILDGNAEFIDFEEIKDDNNH